MILKSPLLEKRKMRPFVHVSIVFIRFNVPSPEKNFSKYSGLTSGGISSRLAAFCFIFFSSVLISSSVNCLRLMTSSLWIIFGRFINDFCRFSKQILKTICFPLDVLFFLLYFIESFRKRARNLEKSIKIYKIEMTCFFLVAKAKSGKLQNSQR